jgi:hypothetical protein
VRDKIAREGREGRVEEWKRGRVEERKSGREEERKSGRVEEKHTADIGVPIGPVRWQWLDPRLQDLLVCFVVVVQLCTLLYTRINIALEIFLSHNTTPHTTQYHHTSTPPLHHTTSHNTTTPITVK